MNLTPLQKLDKVLKILNDYHLEKINPNIAELLLKADDQITLSDSYLVLNKLIADKYTIAIHDESVNAIAMDKEVTYKITFDGLVFIEQGGYQIEQELISSERTRIESTIIFQREQTLYLNRLTFWIAVASCIAAVYYLYFLFQDLCWCEFYWQKH